MILLFQPSCQQEAIWSASGPTWPPTWLPKPSRIRPKMVPKPIKNQAKYKSIFYINFKLIFYRFLSVLTPKWTPIWCHLCCLFGNVFGLAGSWGQDGPQTRPKRASRTDFGAILRVKMAQRGPKKPHEAPKRPSFSMTLLAVLGLLVCWFDGLLLCWFAGLLVIWPKNSRHGGG